MSKRKTTFGKLQRERDKKAKAASKLERRGARAEEAADDAVEPLDPTELMGALEALQQQFAAGAIDLEEFDARRDDLRRRLDLS